MGVVERQDTTSSASASDDVAPSHQQRGRDAVLLHHASTLPHAMSRPLTHALAPSSSSRSIIVASASSTSVHGGSRDVGE